VQLLRLHPVQHLKLRPVQSLKLHLLQPLKLHRSHISDKLSEIEGVKPVRLHPLFNYRDRLVWGIKRRRFWDNAVSWGRPCRPSVNR
jgi:hypothetical protein